MTHNGPQEEAFALLGDPATHGGEPVRRIDTHAASVFLAGTRAYKVKRAVKFPFLDYSGIAQRKAACEAEMKVNRPYAPGIYLRAVAITRSGATPRSTQLTSGVSISNWSVAGPVWQWFIPGMR